jgi:hypothetical protein
MHDYMNILKKNTVLFLAVYNVDCVPDRINDDVRDCC